MDKIYHNPKNKKRHQFPVMKVSKDDQLMAKGAAKETTPTHTHHNIEDVKKHLQTAIQLELSTIPPYLCGLYSIKEGSNKMSVEIIKSVVLEEMLHMVMVANLMNSIGGKPIIGKVPGEEFVPTYPTHLPGNVDESLVVNLKRFSPGAIDEFIAIEHPAEEPSDPHNHDDNTSYASIGEFYAAILDDLQRLEHEAKLNGKTIFTGTAKQVGPEHYYGAGGKIVTVKDLDDAEDLINEIVGQGEGLGTIFSVDYNEDPHHYDFFGPEVDEYAHYFRFKEVKYGRFYAVTDSAHRDSPNKGLPSGEPFDVDWDAVYKMKENPKMADYPKDSQIYQKMYEFNKTYRALLDNLNDACNGNPDAIADGIPIMYDLKYKAVSLMKIPGEDGQTAGPSFEYVD